MRLLHDICDCKHNANEATSRPNEAHEDVPHRRPHARTRPPRQDDSLESFTGITTSGSSSCLISRLCISIYLFLFANNGLLYDATFHQALF